MEDKTISDKAAMYLEDCGISGDAMAERDASDDGGAMYIHDLIAGFFEVETACLQAKCDEWERKARNNGLAAAIASERMNELQARLEAAQKPKSA